MTEQEFMAKVLALFPNAEVTEDDEGEVCISTGYRRSQDDGSETYYVPMEGA